MAQAEIVIGGIYSEIRHLFMSSKLRFLVLYRAFSEPFLFRSTAASLNSSYPLPGDTIVRGAKKLCEDGS